MNFEKIITVFCSARQSFALLFGVFVIALLVGRYWSGVINENLRLDNLRKDGFNEIIVEGQGETRTKAENNAKRKALEKVNGMMIEVGTKVSDTSTSIITEDGTENYDKQYLEDNIDTIGSADFKSIDYLKYWQDKTGLWHTNIKAVIKIRKSEETDYLYQTGPHDSF